MIREACHYCSKHFVLDLRSVGHLKGRAVCSLSKYLITQQVASWISTDILNQEFSTSVRGLRRQYRGDSSELSNTGAQIYKSNMKWNFSDAF